MALSIPSLSQIMQVSRSRGRNSYAPYMWHELCGAWPMQVYQKDKVPDVSGRGNRGTMMNMDPATDRVMTPYGPGLAFDGADDYITIADDSRLHLSSGPFTLVAVIRPHFDLDTAVTDAMLIGKQSDGAGNTSYTWKLDENSDKQQFASWLADGTLNANVFGSKTAWNANQWYHLALVFNGVGYRFYVDGQDDGYTADSDQPGDVAGLVDIGQQHWMVDQETPFDGDFAQVMIHARALLPSEIAERFADPNAMWTPRPVQGTFPGVTAYSLTATVGSFTLTGQVIALEADRTLAASVGTFALAGQAAEFDLTYVCAAAVGAFTLAGQDVTLSYSPGATYSLVTAVGAFALTGLWIDLYVGDQTSDSTNTAIVSTTADATAPAAADPSVLQGTVAELL